MTMLLRDVSMRGTQSQDRAVDAPRDAKRWLRRYGVVGGLALVTFARSAQAFGAAKSG